MERECEKIDEEMPIPDEHCNQSSSAVSNSRLNSKDYSNHK